MNDCILPVVAVNVPSSSNMAAIMDCWEELVMENEKLITLLNDYKICLKNTEKDVLKS